MPYLYGESRPEVARELAAHLESCLQCREQLAGWRASVKRLDNWKLPRTGRADVMGVSVLRWAVATLVLLLAGFAVGRLTGPAVDTESLRSSIEPELRRQLTEELTSVVRAQVKEAAESTLHTAAREAEAIAAAYVRGLQAQRAEDRRAVETALARLETERLTDLATLKQELDTLAVNTDAGLRQTTAGLVELAHYRTVARGSEPE